VFRRLLELALGILLVGELYVGRARELVLGVILCESDEFLVRIGGGIRNLRIALDALSDVAPGLRADDGYCADDDRDEDGNAVLFEEVVKALLGIRGEGRCRCPGCADGLCSLCRN
jgi:hypothetical protein